jgi:hypothetical protein
MGNVRPRPYKTSELKSRITNLAQTSVYQVKIQPPAGLFSLLKETGRDLDYNRAGENLELLCDSAVLPGSSFATHEPTNDYAGVTEKMAYRRMYDGTLDLSFMVDRNYNVIEMLDGWLDFISGVGITGSRQSYKSRHVNYRMTYPEQYRTELYLTKFEKDVSYPDDFGDVIEGVLDPPKQLLYTFVGAFPSSVTSTPVSYGPSDVLRVNVSFSYMRYVRERKNVRLNPFGSLNSSLLTALGDFIF